MKVQMLNDKSIVEVNNAYGNRLIEQGKAIPHVEVKETKTSKSKGDAGCPSKT